MNQFNPKDVFDCYPDADQIFVVDNMPFVDKGAAEGHEKFTGKAIEIIKRSELASKPVKTQEEIEAEKVAKEADKAAKAAEKANKPK